MVTTVPIGLLFPGQGSQRVEMGKALCAEFGVARDIFKKANDVLGYDLQKICFEGPESELVLTRHSQVAILTTSIACWEVLKQQGLPLEVAGCAGLSLGEYSALVVAGVLRFEDALRLVQARASYMQEACDLFPGGMASILGLGPEQARELCRTCGGNGSSWILDVANINCPGQIVISGNREAIAKACEQVSNSGSGRAIPLNVSGAFHSGLMQAAAEKMRAVIGQFSFDAPHVPVFSNVTGQRVENASQTPDLLIRQVTSTVLWESCVRSLLELRPKIFIEAGAGKVLTGLLRKIDRNAICYNFEDPESLAKMLQQITNLNQEAVS